MIPRAILRPAARLQRSPRLMFAACSACVFVIGLIDMATSYEFVMGVFYLPPVLVAAGYCGRRAGVLLSLIAAALWLFEARHVHTPAGVPSWLIHWQILERLLMFLMVIFLVDAMLARARLSGRQLAHERRTSKIKSEMLSLVSHEVNNSMTMISLAVHQLEAEGEGVASREDICAIVNRNVSRMTVVAKNFLSEARLASGKFKLKLASERLEEIVGNVVDALRPSAAQKQIEASWSVAPPGLRAIVDRDALGVALTNLVSNAIKYTERGGRVAVDVRLLGGSPGRASVCVEDNGIGIAARDQARVLAAFERTDPGQRKAAGFGLGLKIAHDLIKAHGGALAIESAPGKGSKISFWLRV